MTQSDNMTNRWNRRRTGSILAPNPTGLLVNVITRCIKVNKIKKQRQRQGK